MLSLAIIITLDTTHSSAATQMDIFRPMNLAMGPPMAELTNAPRIMSDEINCWRVCEMLYPIGEFGSACPKICSPSESVHSLRTEGGGGATLPREIRASPEDRR